MAAVCVWGCIESVSVLDVLPSETASIFAGSAGSAPCCWNQLMCGRGRSTPRRTPMSSPGWRRDFFRRTRADIEPMGEWTRSNNSGFRLPWSTREIRDGLAAGADHADIFCVGPDGPAQDAHVIAMAARDDHKVRRIIDGEAGKARSKSSAMTSLA